MSDFATAITTAPDEPVAPSMVGVIWEQNLGQSFIAQMKGSVTPRTPVESGGSGSVRPTTGLIFPRGM